MGEKISDCTNVSANFAKLWSKYFAEVRFLIQSPTSASSFFAGSGDSRKMEKDEER